MRTSSHGRIIAVAATLAVAGCGASSSIVGQANGPKTGTAAVTSDHRLLRPMTPEQIAQRLIDTAAAPPGAIVAATSPAKVLDSPPEVPVVAGVIVRHRWWRVAMSARAAYSWVAQHQVLSLHSEASGSSGGPTLSDNERNIDFTALAPSSTVNDATLTLAVAPLTAHTSAIGAYAVVVPQPIRQHAEDVPFTVDSVTVTARRTAGSPGNGRIISQHTVTGAQARTFVRDFDQLRVRPAEVTPCPLSMQTDSATFRAGDQVWVATTGICIGASVTLNGHPLATLDTSDPFDRDLHAALASMIRRPLIIATPVH